MRALVNPLTFPDRLTWTTVPGPDGFRTVLGWEAPDELAYVPCPSCAGMLDRRHLHGATVATCDGAGGRVGSSCGTVLAGLPAHLTAAALTTTRETA